MEIQRVKLSELKHDKKNARRHDERNVEEIKRSLQEFGQHRPFVVQRGTNKVIVGNGMLDAMLALGMTEGDAYIVDDDEETSIRRALADNRTGDLAEWDMPLLRDLFLDMDDLSKVIGWSEEELSATFGISDIEDTSYISEKELKPYQKVHYLISVDINTHDKLLSIIEDIKKLEGVEIDSTLN